MTPPRDERGMSESVQWAVLAPSLLLLVLGILQYGLWWHASNVAQAAADAAAETATVVDGSTAEARAVALRVAAQGDLRDVQVSVTSSGASVRVVVTGSPVSLLPAALTRVESAAELPKEPT